AVVVSAAWHASNRGAISPRYVLGLVPILSALLARAVAELPAPRLILGAVVAALGAVVVSTAARIQSLIDLPGRPRPFGDAAAGPSVRVVIIGTVVAAAVACLWVGARLGPIGADEGDDPTEAPTGDAPLDGVGGVLAVRSPVP